MSYNYNDQSNTFNLHVTHNFMAFLYVLGLQDITSRLKQFYAIWMREVFSIVFTHEEVIYTSWYSKYMRCIQ